MTNNNAQIKRFIFDNLYFLIMAIHEQYYVRAELLKNKKFDKVRGNHRYFFDIVLYSLENNLFLDLSVLFSQNNSNQISFDKLLSLFEEKDRKPIRDKIKNNNEIITKIFVWRNKNKGHKDLKTSMNPEDFEQKHRLKFVEIEKLLTLSREIYDDIEMLYRKEKNPFIIDGSIYDLKSEIKSLIEKLS